MKSKHKNQKAVSLLLAVVMLIGIIPLGTFGVGAITVPDVNDTGKQETYVIESVDDWNAVASASNNGNTFKGDIVRLGANIGDVNGAVTELTALFPAKFEGTFDGGYNVATGEGCTISNVTVAGTLIAVNTSGAVIQNVKVCKVAVNHTAASINFNKVGLVVADLRYASALKNVVVDNCSSTTNSYDMAFLAGYVDGNSQILNCAINDSTLNANGVSGLAVGRMVGGTVNGLTVENSTVTYNGKTNYGVGGLIGDIRNGTATLTGITVNNLTVNDTLNADRDMKGIGLIVGEVQEGGSLIISDSNLNGTVTTWADAVGGIAGAATIKNGCRFNVTNTNINATLTTKNTTSANNNGVSALGGGIGVLNNPTALTGGEIKFKKVNVAGTFTAPNLCIGGLVGAFAAAMIATSVEANNENTYNVGMTVDKCEINPTFNVTGYHYYGVGMVAGQWGGTAQYSTGYSYNTGVLSVENSILGGTINHTKSNIAWGGSVLGILGSSKTTVNVTSSILSTKNNVSNDSITIQSGVVFGRPTASTGSALTLNNCVALESSLNMFFYMQATNFTLNGKAHKTNTDNGLLVRVTEDKLGDKMIVRDANGFVEYVSGQLTAGFLQYTQSYLSSGRAVYAIRFIALTQIANPSSAGITVVAKDSKGEIIKTFTTSECELYDTLNAYSPTGDDSVKVSEYSATKNGAEKFMAVIVENIPVGVDYIFEVTPHVTTSGGVTVTGTTQTVSFSANGTPNAN